MTPEQNEQWQRAINPLDYLDFHALTQKGLQETELRLMSTGVPGWAMQLRSHLITLGWKAHEPWTPNFALHSEIALVGLQLQYRADDPQVDVYRRLLLRFFHEALNPIVVWVLEGDDVRRNGYQALLQVQELCQHLLTSSDPPGTAEHLAWSQVLTEAMNPESNPYRNEINSSLDLTTLMLSDWQYVLFFLERRQTAWSRLRGTEVGNLVLHLHRHHRRRLEDNGDAPVGYEAIAAAYVIALETECPPPDSMREAI